MPARETSDATAPATDDAAADGGGVLDAHVHLWDTLRLDYPWLKAHRALKRPYLIPDFRMATNGLEIREFIVVEGGVAAAHGLDEVNWINELAAANPAIVGLVAAADVATGDAVRERLVALRDYPLVKAVRRGIPAEKGGRLCLKADFVAGVRLLDEFDLAFDLLLQPDQLAAVAELAALCPEVRFVCDHLAKPLIRDHRLPGGEALLATWRAGLRALAAQPNVACKLSGLVSQASPKWTAADLQPYYAHVFEVFGPDRVLYGGDWPVCTGAATYEKMFAAFQSWSIGLSAIDQAKLYRLNARHWYRL